MPSPELRLWRVFPWDEGAAPGAPFSPAYAPRASGRGRFDLPGEAAPVLYLAESPEHAVAEVLDPWRGRRIDARHLRRAGRPLALAGAGVAEGEALADLCDPDRLAALGIAPDALASRHRHVTQPQARRVVDAGFAGLRWWSRFWGDWHTVVLYPDILKGAVRWSPPEALTMDAPAVRDAARALGAEVE